MVINDPRGERFNIDRDAQGRDTLFGNHPAKLRRGGEGHECRPAPGQVRPGLHLLREMLRLLERFASRLGTSIISCEALFYHNAIQYERYGFGYLEGRKMMEEINREFLPGGNLFEKLDHSTPFRGKGAEKSARGRSWAIQDGILGRPGLLPGFISPWGKSWG